MMSLTVINDKYAKRERKPATLDRPALKVLTSEIFESETPTNILKNSYRKLDKTKGSWGWYLRRLENAIKSGKPRFQVFVEGNSKLPFYSFSTLPSYTCPGAGGCVDFCYSFRAWRYPGAWCRQVQNTLMLRNSQNEIAKRFLCLPQDVVLRLYVDGDFDSAKTLRFWMKLLDARPDIRAYSYSKSWKLLWQYGQRYAFPANFVLNLSSGGKDQGVTREQMRALPCVRGDFLSLPIDYKSGKAGNVGFDRYDDPAYHAAVREAAAKQGLGKVFSCPVRCGSCAGGAHACGSKLFNGVTVAIGIH